MVDQLRRSAATEDGALADSVTATGGALE